MATTRKCLLVISMFAGLFAASLSSSAAVFAKVSTSPSDPLVVIAQDITTNGCHLIYGEPQGLQSVSRTALCPAGTVIRTQQVRLSEAHANGTPYVTLPARNSSLLEQAKVKAQIFALLASQGKQTGQKVTPAGGIHPNSCTTGYSVSATVSPSGSTDIFAKMSYQRCTTGSLYLESGYTKLTSGGGFYWDHDQYASGSWGRSCQSISTTGNTGGMNSSRSANNYYEPYVTSGSSCTVFDTYIYTNIGPAN